MIKLKKFIIDYIKDDKKKTEFDRIIEGLMEKAVFIEEVICEDEEKVLESQPNLQQEIFSKEKESF